MSRAGHEYDVPEWQTMFEESGLTQADVAGATGVSERHIANVLSGQTKLARHRTAKKIKEGLIKRGIVPSKVERLLVKKKI